MSPPLPTLLARQLVLQGRVSAGEPHLCPRDPLQQISYCRLRSGGPFLRLEPVFQELGGGGRDPERALGPYLDGRAGIMLCEPMKWTDHQGGGAGEKEVEGEGVTD